jgi:hypothetical protein
MTDEAERFWSDFEAETGEKVEARAVGTWYEEGGDSQGTWGLLILTDKAFRFKYMPSESWLSSLFKSVKRSRADKRILDITVPLDGIVAFQEPKRSFLDRLFGSAFPRFDLAWSEGDAIRKENFSLDPSTGLLARLRKLPRNG